MKKQRIIILIVLILALVAVTTTLITAWLTDSKEAPGSTTFTVGDIEFTWNGALTTQTPVVPGQELIGTAYSLVNASTVTSHIRVIVEISATRGSGEGQEELEDPASYFVSTALASGWVYNEDDGMWYYATVDDDELIPTTIPAASAQDVPIPVLSSLKLNGAVADSNISNYVYEITFTFQAKQAQYVHWEDLGAAAFTLGGN